MTRGDRLPGLQARRIAGGFTLSRLAYLANVSDLTIIELENGGNCDEDVMIRILNTLAPPVAVTSTSIANPTVVTTAANTFLSLDTVTITGHAGSTPAVSGDYVATVTAGTTFTVPVNVTGGGTGGTASLSATTLGVVRLG